MVRIEWNFSETITSSNFFSDFERKLTPGLSKCLSKETFWENFFQKILSNSNGNGAQTFSSVVKSAFKESRSTFWDETLWNHLQIQKKYFPPSSGRFLAGLSKLHSTLPEEHFGRNFFKKELKINYFSLTLSWEFSAGMSRLHCLYPEK